MAGSRLSTVCRQFTALAADAAADADLLARFADRHDEAAFAALVRRHGPMVWSACRNLLPNPADADDAFQATFVALARGAKAVRRPEALGAFLHGVAVRVAVKLRRAAARRRQREQKVATAEAARPVAESQWDDVLAAVHEEVNKLPDGERTAFVVCCLEGVRQPEAAERLGWKPGTLTGRLSKAKARLLARLTARGLAPAAALAAVGIGAATGQALVPPKLLDAVQAFAGPTAAVPASILQLSQGVFEMTITKVKLLAAAVLVAGGLATSIGARFLATADAETPNGLAAPLPPPAPAAPPGGVPATPGITPTAPKATGQPVAGAPMSGTTPLVPGAVPRGSVVRPFEYQFFDTSAMTVGELKKTVDTEGEKGWELVTIEHRQFNGSGGTEHLAIFKRAKAPGATTLPGAGGPPGTAPRVEEATPAPAKGLVELYRSLEKPAPATAGTLTLHTISVRTGNSAQMAKVFKELIAIGEFNQEVTAVIADEGSNSLLVKATDAGAKLVQKQVDRLEAAALDRNRRDSERGPGPATK